ncbi:MAG: MFS superfamily sulfate permease-like transporter [Roseivirga sp.]|jgi:MFS superfamily sulfate permease-like transporter
MKSDLFKTLNKDAPAGLVVFLVAVPLCLGIALASGAPLFSGIIAGMVGGIIVTALSGSDLGVSGPAAGLTVIVLSAISELGSFEIFLTAVMIGGLLQVVLSLLRAGIIGYYFPTSVIKGMLSAIGIIIFLKQIPHAFGYDKDYEGDLNFIQADGQNTFTELYNMMDFIAPGAIIVSVFSLFVLILWEQKFMKKIKIFGVIQGPLVVVVGGIILGKLLLSTSFEISPEHMVSIPVSSSLVGFFNQFTLPDFSQIGNPEVWIVGFTIAIVASLETLLCVEATDKLDPLKRITPTNKELRAQGIGNLVSGFIGGLPVTQVIVRSSANIQSGGQTKVASFIHGLLILVSAMLIPGVLNLIPLASLAAILFVVGYKLAKPAIFKQIYSEGIQQFIPFVVTVLAIILTDLLVGIGIGLAVAIFFILRKNYLSPFVLKTTQEIDDKHYRIVLSENVTFLNKASIMKELNNMPNDSFVLIDASKTIHIEHDVLEIISDFIIASKHKNIQLNMSCAEHLDLNAFKEAISEILISEAELNQLPLGDDLKIVKSIN